MSLQLFGKQDVYLEIAERFEGYILSGLYQTGEKLPSVRTVAAQLRVNPNTVAKAYAVLEEKGLVRALPKKGAFVTYGASLTTGDTAAQDIRPILWELKRQGLRYEDILLQAKEVFLEDDTNS